MLEIIKAAMPVSGNIFVFAVDQTVCNQICIYTQRSGAHVFVYVVAYHQAVARRFSGFLQDFPVIAKVWFTEGTVLIGCDKIKNIGIHAGPAQPVLGSTGGENGICRGDEPIALVFQKLCAGMRKRR